MSLLHLPHTGLHCHMDRVKRIWYLSPVRAAKVQARLRIRALSPEPSLLAHTSSESRATIRQKARSLTPLNGWACAVKICHDGMLEDTNSLGGAHIVLHCYLYADTEKNIQGFTTRVLTSVQFLHRQRFAFEQNHSFSTGCSLLYL